MLVRHGGWAFSTLTSLNVDVRVESIGPMYELEARL